MDAIRLGPADDATAVTAAQLREVINRLRAAGHWNEGDADIHIVMDSGYDVTRLAFVLADLPVEVTGRLRSDRVLLRPAPPRRPGTNGRPRKHGGTFTLAKSESWHEPDISTVTATTRYGNAEALGWDRLHPRVGVLLGVQRLVQIDVQSCLCARTWSGRRRRQARVGFSPSAPSNAVAPSR